MCWPLAGTSGQPRATPSTCSPVKVEVELKKLIFRGDSPHSQQFNEVSFGDVKVSWNQLNVPLEETIQVLANKAFVGNWFNDTHNMNIGTQL